MKLQSSRLSPSLVQQRVPVRAGMILCAATLIFPAMVFPAILFGQPGKGQTSQGAQNLSYEKAASDTSEVVEIITVTANRDAKPASKVGSSVTVIEREEIQRRKPLFTIDLLRTIPGIEITQTGGPGQVASVRLRGGTAAQVLVLIDGVRANTSNNGDVDFAHLDALNLERVEVLRGPQAAYGSEAMSGVISLTSAKAWRQDGSARRFGFGASAEAGSRSHQRFAANTAFNSGEADPGRPGTPRFDFNLAASDLSTDAVSQLAPPSGSTGTPETDPFELSTLSTRLGLAFGGATETSRLEIRGRDYQGDAAVDGFGVEDLNASATTEGRTLSVSGDSLLSPRWHQTARLGFSETDLQGQDPDTFFNNYTIRSENLMAEAQADIDVANDHRLNLGLSHEQRRGQNLGSFDQRAELDAVFVQDQWSPRGNLNFSAATRYDDHSVFGGETSFRVTGIGSFAANRARVRGSYGTAFRAPNFNELFFPFAGDPTLQPETSKGWDLGFSQEFLGAGRVTVEITAFKLRFENLIQFDLSSFLFANVAEAESSGVEAAATFALNGRTRLQLGHTYNDTEDRTTGAALARRPRNRSVAVLQWSARSISPSADPRSTASRSTAPVWSQFLAQRASGALSAVSVRDRVDSDGSPMDNYVRLDATATFRLGRMDGEFGGPVDAFVRVENALDQDYQEVPGFTTPGATLVIGVKLRH